MPTRAVPLDIWNKFQGDALQQQSQGLLDGLQRQLADATRPLSTAVPSLPSLPDLNDLFPSSDVGQRQPAAQAAAPSSSFAMPSLDDLKPAQNRPSATSSAPVVAGTQAASGPRGDPSGGVEQWNEPISRASSKYNVPQSIIKGIMHIESGGNPATVSAAGAKSLMQVMPFHFGPNEDGMDPETNIDRGTKILADNYARYGDWDKAAAAYFGAIDANGNITGASDGNTDGYGYVQQFNAARARYQGAPAAAAPTAAGSPSSAPAQTAPAQSSAAGASDTVTIRSRATGATMQVPASMVGDAPGHYRSADYEVVPDQMQKAVADMPDDTGPSAGDQKRQKMAAASGQDVEMPQHDPPFDWLPAQHVVNPPATLDNQRTIRNVNFETGAVDGDGSPDATGAVQYRQQEGAPRPGTDQPIQNDDGSVTTERSITVTEPGLNGGRATNIPTVWNGRIVSDDEAVDNAIRSGVAFQSFGSVDEAVRAAEQRSRDLGAGQATSVGGASVPPEVQNALPNRNRPVRGQPIDESGGTMYRQPLQPTMGDTTTGQEQPYDSRQYDQGAHEGGQVEWNDQPNDPSSISTPAATASATPSTLPIDAASTLMSTSSGTTASATQDSLPTPTNQPSNPADDAGTTQQPAPNAVQEAINWAGGKLLPIVNAAGETLGYVHSGLETAGNAVLGSPEVRAERNRVLRENTRRDVGPIVEPALEAVSQGAAGIEQATGAPAGSVLQAAQDTSNFIGPGTGLLMGGIREVPRPTPQTVEALQQRLQQARSIVDRLIGAGDAERLAMAQENRAAVESALADAQNARRNLEPRIRSDVGAKEPAIPPSAETVENRMESIRPQGGPMAPEDLSGPVSIPTNTGERLNVAPGVSGSAGIAGDVANSLGGGVAGATVGAGLPADSDQERLQHGLLGAGAGMIAGPVAGRLMRRGEGGARASFGVGPNGERYDPRLSQEPVLPGFEDQAPRTRPTVRGEPGDAAAQSEMRAGGSALPGMDRLAAERFAAVRDAALAGDPAPQAEMRAAGVALPGMESQAADRFAPVRDVALSDDAAQAQQEMRGGGVALPGMEGLAADRYDPARSRVPGATTRSAAQARGEMRAGGTALPGLESQAADRFAPVRDSVPGATASEAAKAIAEMRTSHLPPQVARALQAAEQRSRGMADKGITKPSAWDWIKQAGYAGIYGPATAVNSAIGGAQELVLGGVKEAVRSAVEGRPIVTRASARAQVSAAAEGLKGLGRVLIGSDAGGAAAVSGGSQGTAGLSDRVTGRGARFAARALERPGEILTEAPDAVFRPLFRSQGMEREASRVAQEMRIPPPQRGAYAQQLIADAEAVRNGGFATMPETQRVLDAGEKYADELGYKGKPGAFGQWLGKVSKRDDAVGVAASFLMPFPSMAARMTEAAIKSTPGSALLPGVRKMYPSRFDMVYDQAAGAVVASGVAYWAMNGGVTGSGPDDSEKRAQMVSDGWQPNSVLVGGHYIPNRMFQRFQPMLDTAGELHDALAYGKEGRTAPQIADQLVKRGSKIATDQIGLSGLADLHDMLDSGFSAQFPGWAARSITRYVPYGGVLRAAAASMDSTPRKADRWTDGSPLPAIGENIKTAVPGLRQTVPATQDVLGRPAENPQQGFGAIIPKVTTAKNDPTIRAFTETGVDIAPPPDKVSGVALTPAQKRRYQQVMGTELQRLAGPTISGANWQTMPPQTRKILLESFQSTAKTLADVAVTSEGGQKFNEDRTKAILDKALGR